MNQLEQQQSLHNDIRGIWLIEEQADAYNFNPIIPDSSIDLVINCGAPLVLRLADGTNKALPPVFIKGLQKTPLRLAVTGENACIIGVSLHAWSISALPDVQLSNTTQSIVPVGGKWRNYSHTIVQSVKRNGYAEAAHIVRQILEETYHSHRDFTAIRDAAKVLYHTQGQFPIRQLAAYCHLSLSQLERRFKCLTGVTLKSFARLIRFENARNRLHSDQAIRLTDLAYDLGYTDQAHFTRDFKDIASYTPSAYLKQFSQTSAQNADFLQDR